MPKKIIMLNASALRISHCKRRLHHVVIDGYRSKLNSAAIEFGSAFHLCPKVVYQTKGNIGAGVNAARVYFRDTPSVQNPKKKFLNDFMLSKACQDWFMSDLGPEADQFEILRDVEDNALVESTFAIPYYAGDNVEVILCGTIDKIVVHRQSKLICEGDFKTTTSWDELEYLRGYVLNTQRYFYNIALRHMITNSAEGSVLHAFKGKDVGSFVDGIFIKSGGDTVCKRSSVEIPTEKQRAEYERLLTNLCKWFDTTYNYDPSVVDYTPDREGLLNGTCKTGFTCDFFDACACNDSVASEHVLRRNFIQVPYNPLSRSENL